MKYFGGKNGQGSYQNIINIIPPHKHYFELFLGSGAIIRNKKPAQGLNIGCELNRAVIDEFHYDGQYKVKNECGIKFLEKLKRTRAYIDSFIYLDPPYDFETRRNKKKVYKFELNRKDHERILKTISTMRYHKIAISCYDCELYATHLKGWNKIQYRSQTRKGIAIETVYFNYPKPTQLHEYTYLGKDFTDRQRIKRKIQRHINRLMTLNVLERSAIVESIYDSGMHHS